MASRLVMGFAFATTLMACVPQTQGTSAPRPLKPIDGPRASIHVQASGGPFSRQIQTRFRLDRAGYVMVGHLGGDGQLRLLYPETPNRPNWVAAGESVTLRPVSAMYDMAPHMYSFALTPYRNVSARNDSYDGFGHGYVFIVTSEYPIYLGDFMAGRSFETLQIEDYDNETDPRFAVRELADDVTIGPYSLTYARNDGFYRYALGSGCAARWSRFGYDPFFDPWGVGYSLFGYPGMSLWNAFVFAHHFGVGGRCGGSYYAGLPFYYRSTIYNPIRPVLPPQGEITPELQRPTRRTLGEQDRSRGPLTTAFRPHGRRSGFEAERRRSGSSRPYTPTRTRSRGVETGHGTTTEASRPERASRPVDRPHATSRPAAPVQPAAAKQGDNVKATRPPKP